VEEEVEEEKRRGGQELVRLATFCLVCLFGYTKTKIHHTFTHSIYLEEEMRVNSPITSLSAEDSGEDNSCICVKGRLFVFAV